MTRRRKVVLILLAPIAILLLYVLVQVARGPVDLDLRQESFEHDVGHDSAASPGAPSLPAEAAADDEDSPVTTPPDPIVPAGPPLRAYIDLSEGQFDIRPGEPGEPVRIEADYDAGTFSLYHELETDAEGSDRLEVLFRREVSALRGLFRKETWDNPNRIRVYLPPEIPLDLTLVLSKGQRDVDLTGLAVTRLDLEATQGQTNLRFDAPNPVAMDTLIIRNSQGQIDARGLGYADAREVELRGSMGQMTIDFDGAARGATRALIRMSMGQVDLALDADRPLSVERAQAFLGHVEEPSPSSSGEPETLSLDMQASFGAIETRSR